MKPISLPFLSLLAATAILAPGCASPQPAARSVPQWGQAELSFTSSNSYENPLQEARLTITFVSPSGGKTAVDGFWDGGANWRARFMPDATGRWTWRTACSDSKNRGLDGRQGTFLCTAGTSTNRFALHGPVRVAPDHRHLEHADGTPFFWLGDTCWNGALLSTPADWDHYLRERVRQKFSAIQWVATQWRAAPDGDLQKRLAFTGRERIAVNPAFFQQLDQKAEALNRAGLLNVPVLLWAIGGGSNPEVNPGFALPEDQAILLARYMVARWQALAAVWLLPGDGDYRGAKAERWKRIGQGVFGERPHAPVMLHPGGMHWVWEEFKTEPWLDLFGYQSGHGDDDRALRWMCVGPPTTDWRKEPLRPFLNLEPPYENHLGSQSGQPHPPHHVRRAIYWSLLNAPTAGVTYGGHGVWGWDDGSRPPTDHPRSGIPLPWRKALLMPAAEQMAHVAGLFTAIDFARLRPAPELVVKQPGHGSPARFIAAARSEDKTTVVLYTPEQQMVQLRPRDLPPRFQMRWFNPRDGQASAVIGILDGDYLQLTPPGEGDWVLLVTAKTSGAAQP